MEALIVGLAFIVLLVLAVWRKKMRKKGILEQLSKDMASSDFPYQRKKILFTPAERAFFGVLQKAVGHGAVVFAKVRVADLLYPEKHLDASEQTTARNKIIAKHFDFVLCEPSNLAVISVVELDDTSHQQKQRVECDEFLNSACKSAGLTLHRFKASNGYNIAAVREILFPDGIKPQAAKAQERLPGYEVESPEAQDYCPKCFAKLVRKVASKGKHKGEIFHVCSTYPECRYRVQLQESLIS